MTQAKQVSHVLEDIRKKELAKNERQECGKIEGISNSSTTDQH